MSRRYSHRLKAHEEAMTNIETIRPRRIPATVNEDLILSFSEWAELAGLSLRAARELRARGQGPRCIKITDKKLGVTLAEHRRWTKARMEAVA
jgi:hypothetical protein